MKINKPRIIILSDLWGTKNANWINGYTERLQGLFEIFLYDSCDLAGIDLEVKSEKQRHAKFISGGIDKAVQKLVQKEPRPVAVLAFSIGGTIAWKAILSGLSVKYLFALSATRLRFETQTPSAKIQLFYGARDEFKPKEEWFTQLGLSCNFYEDQTHEFYKEEASAVRICELITDTIMSSVV